MNNGVLDLAVIGAGYWGKNLVRNFSSAKRCNLKYVCDLSDNLLGMHKRSFPSIEATKDLDAVLADEQLDAVAIATPVVSHFELAKRALQAGKHTYVEKPMTLEASQSSELVALANDAGLKLMVGHLLLYHPAVTYLKEMIDKNQLGQPYYMYTQRVNLGIVRKDENAWMSLAPHDISVICHLLGSEPVSVAVHGQCFLQKDIEDVVFATIKFANGQVANVHCSWLDPHKIRKMTVVGAEKMVTFDDMEVTEKIRMYDKGASVKHDITTSYADVISLRFGDIVIPKTPGGEPLSLECAHFVECILDNKAVLSDGTGGLRVVRVLEAGQKSLKNDGKPIDPQEF